MMTLNEFTNEELIGHLGLEDVDFDTLDRYGLNLHGKDISRVLRKLSKFSFSTIRGHIVVDGFTNVSYEDVNLGDRKVSFLYDDYESQLSTRSLTVKINDNVGVKIFISSAKWIDIFFDINGVRTTIVLIP